MVDWGWIVFVVAIAVSVMWSRWITYKLEQLRVFAERAEPWPKRNGNHQNDR